MNDNNNKIKIRKSVYSIYNKPSTLQPTKPQCNEMHIDIDIGIVPNKTMKYWILYMDNTLD